MSVRPTESELNAAARYAARILAKRGKVIEAGWQAYRIAIPKGAPALQIEETRKAFYFGAHHLFSMVLHAVGQEEDPTPEDMQAMDQIDAELQAFIAEQGGVLKGLGIKLPEA